MNNDNFLDELFGEEQKPVVNEVQAEPTPVVMPNNQNIQGERPQEFPVIQQPVVQQPVVQQPVVMQQQPVAVPQQQQVQENPYFQKINRVMDLFGINKKNHLTFKNAGDLMEIINAVKMIKQNIQELRSAFGDEAADGLLELLPEEDYLMMLLQRLLQIREARMKELRDDEEALAAEEAQFQQEVQRDQRLLALVAFLGVYNMMKKRKEAKENGEGGTDTGSLKQIITEEDKEEYMRNLFKKLAIVEKYTGVRVSQELIDFFKSDEYIYSNDLNLPDILRDEDFNRIKNAWSLPVLIDDNREELASKEISGAETSIASLENFIVMNGLGNSQDNQSVQMLNKLKADVKEEKDRVSEDNKFFTKEKLKERVECALLYSVKGQTESPTIKSMSNALKETITARINYMQDETHLRQERKNAVNDKSNKDNERHSGEYQSSLMNANKEVNARREKRAKGEVKFIPQAVVKNRTRAKENINAPVQQNYDKGKAMVLKNNWNRFNNMNMAS